MRSAVPRSIGKWLLLIVAILASIGSFLPLLPQNAWWIRVLDYPRWEIAVVDALALAIWFGIFRTRSWLGWITVTVLLAGFAYNTWVLLPYSPVLAASAVRTTCSPERKLRIFSANVLMSNNHASELLQQLEAANPDIVLLMETNQWWDEHVDSLRQEFPYEAKHISSNTYGMNLFSKLPLDSPQVKFLVSANMPSIFTGVQLPTGDEINLYAIHPRPPRLKQNSAYRDSQLMQTAMIARDSKLPVIVVGDFNSVPWERSVERFARIGRLLDPRVGRMYLPTFEADDPLLRFPLDNIFFQDRIGLVSLTHGGDFGSDHYPLIADVCYDPKAAAQQRAPRMHAGDMKAARDDIRIAAHEQRPPVAARKD